MRIKFLGPEGAKFAGTELRGITPNMAKTGDLAAIQLATRWKMPELLNNVNTLEMVGTQAAFFLTLRNAGFFVSWEEAGNIAQGDFETIQEPGDLPEEEPGGQDADPTSAQTDSALGAAAPAPVE